MNDAQFFMNSLPLHNNLIILLVHILSDLRVLVGSVR